MKNKKYVRVVYHQNSNGYSIETMDDGKNYDLSLFTPCVGGIYKNAVFDHNKNYVDKRLLHSLINFIEIGYKFAGIHIKED